MNSGRRLLISAGEVSGEHHAARVVSALKRLDSGLEIDCFGGRHLEAAGARLIYPLSDFAVLGFAGVFKNLSRFVKILALFDRYLEQHRPDAVVLVDYPGLHVRFAALAHRRGVKVVYFVCPQLWAWAPWRAARFARCVDHALTILPFEERYFARRGIEARYVGHPAADELASTADTAQDLDLEELIGDGAPPIALLPGSRPQEARSNLPLMLDVALRLQDSLPGAIFLVPQTRDDTRRVCSEIVAKHPCEPVRIVNSARPVLKLARFALVASGTATFEVACHGVPMVVLYRITRFQEFLGRQLLTVPWISQVNLIAGRELVPEFVTAGHPVEEITAAALELIGETSTRGECLEALSSTFRFAFLPGASARAAGEILKVLGGRVGSLEKDPESC
ncbi:MAG: lipid-A-disaccharide synthase [Planctomycetota bacterium]